MDIVSAITSPQRDTVYDIYARKQTRSHAGMYLHDQLGCAMYLVVASSDRHRFRVANNVDHGSRLLKNNAMFDFPDENFR